MGDQEPRGRPGVFVRLEPEVLNLLQEKAGETTHGRSGGIALLVRKIIYEWLGLPVPMQYGDKDPKRNQGRKLRTIKKTAAPSRMPPQPRKGPS